MGYILLMLTVALVSVLSAINTVYEESRSARAKPIKGFVQLLQIIVSMIGAVLVIAVLIERSPFLLLSGFGAMTAILILVFRDTLLSLVASVQLSGQDLIRLDDWIEMPSLGADGEVIDMALHTVKVQNWDKTITSIPTHRLISDSFKNWRGMTESGGRRIKRAFHIDVSTVRFLTDEEIERFRNFVLLRDYIERKQQELDDYNASIQGDREQRINLRRLTNIGTLRAYLVNYLAKHPRVHDSMTQMVRQLEPTPNGVPLEIYAFTRTTVWAEYEGIQSDIFDHVFSIVGEFGLAIFQAPAGTDFRRVLQPDTHKRETT
jgi:miniconductance mechanosensitive channel